MISFISNSKVKIFYIVFIVITLCVLGLFEYAVRQYEKVDWYQIRRDIETQNPDIILIGNSMLQTHVNKKLFQDELSNLAGRPINAYTIQRSGCNMPTFYLILKFQLVTSHLSNIPVGIMDFSESNFFSVGSDGTERGLIKEAMPENDKFFLDHYYDSSLKFRASLRSFCQSCYFSPEFSRQAVTTAAVKALQFLGMKGDLSLQVKNRFDKIGGLENKNAVEQVYTPRRGLSFKDRLAASFIPETVKIMSRFKLFFIVTHHAPNDTAQNSLEKTSSSDLKKYLSSKSVQVIDLRTENDLNKAEYYYDHIHATKEGQAAVSKLLAKRVIEAGLIQ